MIFSLLLVKKVLSRNFFHTFNALYNSKKQIILSSDKPPKELDVLEERLRSRFSWGLPVDIQPPNYETKVAILRKRAELDNIYIDDEILTILLPILSLISVIWKVP